MARKSADLGKRPVTVYLREGTYYLADTVRFTCADSGAPGAAVTYSAYEGETVVISGGTKLKLAWKPYRNGILRAKTPEGLEFDQLFVDGKRQHMARYPNFYPDVLPYNGFSADAFSPDRAAAWADPAGGFIHAMHRLGWGGYHYRITGKTPDNTVAHEGGWQNNRQMGMHGRHRFVENIFEELDAPGEWFHNPKTRTLYYYPATGVDVNSATFEVAGRKHLVEFRGSQQDPVKHITLSGIVFRHAARTFMETKEPLLRSDWTIYRGGAVRFEGAEDCMIADSEFDQVGGNAVFVNNYNRRITVRGTHIHGAGASGVCFVGDPESVRNPLFEYRQRQSYEEIDKTPGPKSDNYPGDCLVEDCLIHNVSVVEKQATGVQISMSKGITVRHCSVYDVGRAGINISEGTFGGHLIEFCDVFDTVRETGDHGSFNSWGRDRFWGLKDAPANELPELALLDAEKTIIRNSRWRCDHGWDVDLDDGSSNYEIYNNLFLHGGLKLREGFHRRVYNNIAFNSTLHAHVWYENSQDVITGNIWMAPYARPIRMCAGRWGKEVDRNFFMNEEQRTMYNAKGWDLNSLSGDPMFMDPAKGDFRVKDESPALKIGFKNFPMDRFGVQKPSLKAIARSPSFSRESPRKAPAAPTAAVILNDLIPGYVRGNGSKLLGEAAWEKPERAGWLARGSLCELAALYRKAGVTDYDWHTFGPERDKMMWDYYSFDPRETKPWQPGGARYRTVTYPEGMESWFAPDFDAKKANWKSGFAPFGQQGGKPEAALSDCPSSWCRCSDPVKTLWEKEVLLLRGSFEFPRMKKGCRYRLLIGGSSHVNGGDGLAVYLNGKLITEQTRGVGRNRGGKPRGVFIDEELAKEFTGGKVTIAVKSFLRMHRRSKVIGNLITIWMEEMKIPPLDSASTSDRAEKWLGATIAGLADDEFSAFGVSKEDGGIHLVTVPSGWAAARAGLKAGDLVQSADGKAVETPADLLAATTHGKGKAFAIGLVRGQKDLDLRLEPGPLLRTNPPGKE